MAKFEIYNDKRGEFRFRLKAGNGQNILASEGYKAKSACTNGIESVAVSYYDENGDQQTQEVRGYSACTWQHEYDHLDGILFPHRVTDSQSFCSWESFKEYQEADYARHVRELVAEWGN